jgi:hypothetical protein
MAQCLKSEKAEVVGATSVFVSTWHFFNVATSIVARQGTVLHLP